MSNDRIKHTWDVDVQTEDGAVGKEPVNAYWDPAGELTPESVAAAAVCQIKARTGKTASAIGAEQVA